MNKDIIDQAFLLLKDYLKLSQNRTILEISSAANIVVNFPIFERPDIDKNVLLNKIVDRYQEDIGVRAFKAEVLNKGGEDQNWFFEKKKNNLHKYFERYKRYLTEKNFPEDSIIKMEETTEEILSYCANPDDESDLKNRRKKGLVMGDVQSGKTANYLGLMNMAVDYGYKVIVLLAGMTESLRVQTQKRVDDGFVGAISESIGTADIQFIGVGAESENYYSIPMTDQKSDFSSNNSTPSDYAKPMVFVVKKNRRVLEQMSDWLKPDKINFSSKNILIIDDESDNASVNTKSDDDPSIINKLIRNLFNNFPIATYVGFTATPFANIFIDPYDNEANRDLFPSDFIVQLKAPSNYFGIKKIFEKNNGRYTHIRLLDEAENQFLPVKHKKNDAVFDYLPVSLKEAIFDFLIANVIRTLRDDKTAHRTMMINISRFNKIQEQIEEKVSDYISNLKRIIEQTYKLSFDIFIQNEDMKMLYTYYEENYHYEKIREEFTWDQIQNGLYDEINQIQISVFKNKQKNRFNYDDYKDVGARLIAIGGFVLSRGLTLEGLIISYFSRSANAYDTVLQMCRWFGYRNHYEDLCRVYMSDINVDCYEAVIDAIEDLKQQFTRMRVMGGTPQEYGLAVKESPDTLETMMLITSRSKMKNTKEIERPLNYSGRIVDTSKLFYSDIKAKNNYKMVYELSEKLKNNGMLLEKINGRYMFKDVDKSIIAKFIKKLIIPMENKKFEKDSISDYIENSNEFKKWDIVIATGDESNKKWYFCKEEIPMVMRSFNVRQSEDYLRISGHSNRLSEPGIFNSGLSKEEIEKIKKEKHGSQLIARDYLSVKGRNPLLVIYPLLLSDITEASKDNNVDDEFEEKIKRNFDEKNVLFGFAIGFPGSESKEKVKYRVNLIKLSEMINDFEEEDMEDFDDGEI